MSVVTSNNCNTSFVAALPGTVPVGYAITATATDSANNTSEFSACVAAGPVPALAVQPATSHQVAVAWTNTSDRLCAETDQQSLAADPMDRRDEYPGCDQRPVRRHAVRRHRQPLLRPEL